MASARRWWWFALLGLLASVGWIGGVCIAARGIPLAQLPASIGAITLYIAAVGVSRTKRPWFTALLVGAGTLPAFALVHSFLWQTTAVGYMPVMLFFAAYPALFVWCAARLMRRWPGLWTCAFVPLLWAGLEVLRGEVILGGYSWLLLGHAFMRDGGPGLLAPVIGQYGVSFLIMLIVSGVMDIGSRGRAGAASRFNITVGCVVILVMGATVSLAPPTSRPSETVRIAAVQTNLPQSNKLAWPVASRWESHVNWLGLTAFAGRVPPEAESPLDVIDVPGEGATPPTPLARPGLIVWPETMFAGEALNPEALAVQRDAGLSYALEGKRLPATAFADSLVKQQADVGIPMLVGAIAADGLQYDDDAGRVRSRVQARYNSMLMVRGGRVETDRYDKIDLMPFGEYVPVAWRWPAAQKAVADLGGTGMAFDLAMGTSPRTFAVQFATSTGRNVTLRLATPICFEACYDRSCRRLVVGDDGQRRADLMINVSNDGWFYQSRLGRELFMLGSRWRAAELGTPVLRVANTGISCVIDRYGSVLHNKLDTGPEAIFNEGVMTADVPFETGELTTYARYGTVILWALGVGGVCVIALATLAGPWPKLSRRARKAGA